MNDKELLISVIIPIYNVGKYLRQCIESLIKQSYQNIEIILIDDGSSDDSPQICDEYAASDKRVKVIHKSNGGVTSARKDGLFTAKGEYAVCVDGDDYVTESYIEDFVNVINDSYPDIVQCGFTRHLENRDIEIPASKTKVLYQRKEIEHLIFPSLIKNKENRYYSYSLCGKAYRCEIFRECLLEESDKLVIGEDAVCFMAMAVRAQSITVIPTCGYFYRSNTTSLTRKRAAHNWNGALLEAEYIKKMIDISQFDFADQLNRLVANRVFGIASSQFYRDCGYIEICTDIKQHLREPVYSEAIRKAEFSGNWKAKIMLYTLRNESFLLMWLWAKVKTYR